MARKKNLTFPKFRSTLYFSAVLTHAGFGQVVKVDVVGFTIIIIIIIIICYSNTFNDRV